MTEFEIDVRHSPDEARQLYQAIELVFGKMSRFLALERRYLKENSGVRELP